MTIPEIFLTAVFVIVLIFSVRFIVLLRRARKRKIITPKEQSAITNLAMQAMFNMEKNGRAGTWVGLGEDGKVKVKLLSEREINEILSLRSEGNPIPDSVTIYSSDGTKLKSLL